MTSVTSLPFEKQDSLEEGLLKVNVGTSEEAYADFFVCRRKAGGESKAFAELSEQDKLKEGMIKVAGGEYVPVDKLGEIETITEVDINPKDHDDEHFFGYGQGCFVATAVYGDINAPQVQTLRNFRDDVLMQSWAGIRLVNFYYDGAGKRTANFVKKHLPSSIPVIRKCLDFFVDKYSKNR